MEEKFKEELFWKFYEIRDAFIPDSPEDEVIIALDLGKTVVENKPCELLEHLVSPISRQSAAKLRQQCL